MQKVLVVCMGNICRSPTAEAVLRAKAAQLKVDVEIDSAGTIGITKGIHRMHAQKRQVRSGDTHFQGSKRERSAMKIL